MGLAAPVAADVRNGQGCARRKATGNFLNALESHNTRAYQLTISPVPTSAISSVDVGGCYVLLGFHVNPILFKRHANVRAENTPHSVWRPEPVQTHFLQSLKRDTKFLFAVRTLGIPLSVRLDVVSDASIRVHSPA